MPEPSPEQAPTPPPAMTREWAREILAGLAADFLRHATIAKLPPPTDNEKAAALTYALARLDALGALAGALREAAAMMAEFANGDAEHLEEFVVKWQLRFTVKAKEARAVLAADALLKRGG